MLEKELEIRRFRKKRFEPTNIKDGYLIPQAELNNMGLVYGKDGQIYRIIYIAGMAIYIKYWSYLNKFPYYNDYPRYRVGIDKISTNYPRLFFDDDVPFNYSKQFTSTPNKCGYNILGLQSESINYWDSLSNQFFDSMNICIDRGHFIIPLEAHYEATGKPVRILKNFDLDKYGMPETKEDFGLVIRDQIKYFNEVEIFEDHDHDITDSVDRSDYFDYMGTLYTKDGRYNPKTNRVVNKPILKIYDKGKKENYSYASNRLEVLISHKIDMFQKLLSPDALDKNCEEYIHSVKKDVVKYFNKRVDDIKSLSDSIPESRLLSYFSGKIENLFNEDNLESINQLEEDTTSPTEETNTSIDSDETDSPIYPPYNTILKSIKDIYNLFPLLSGSNTSGYMENSTFHQKHDTINTNPPITQNKLSLPIFLNKKQETDIYVILKKKIKLTNSFVKMAMKYLSVIIKEISINAYRMANESKIDIRPP